jgi:hypothetical protein
MTTRIQPSGPRATVQEDRTAARVTDPPARPFREILDAGAGAVVSGAESATRQLPGGPILAAAFRPSAETVAGGPAVELSSPEGPSGTAAQADGLGSARTLGEGDQALYYLQLQQQISAESRAYTALSNVLKARHDTVKNAIGNIR